MAYVMNALTLGDRCRRGAAPAGRSNDRKGIVMARRLVVVAIVAAAVVAVRAVGTHQILTGLSI